MVQLGPHAHPHASVSQGLTKLSFNDTVVCGMAWSDVAHVLKSLDAVITYFKLTPTSNLLQVNR